MGGYAWSLFHVSLIEEIKDKSAGLLTMGPAAGHLPLSPSGVDRRYPPSVVDPCVKSVRLDGSQAVDVSSADAAATLSSARFRLAFACRYQRAPRKISTTTFQSSRPRQNRKMFGADRTWHTGPLSEQRRAITA